MAYIRLALFILALLPLLQAQDAQEVDQASSVSAIFQRVSLTEITERLKKFGETVRDKAKSALSFLKRKAKEALGVCAYNLEDQLERVYKEVQTMLNMPKPNAKGPTWEVESLSLINVKGMFEALRNKLHTLNEKDLDLIIDAIVKIFQHGFEVKDVLVDILEKEGLVCFKWLVKKTIREIGEGNFYKTENIA